MIDLSNYDAILVLSYGGPKGPADVLPFMRNATRGRGVPDARLIEVSKHYERYNGVSPINACNERLVEDLKAKLSDNGCQLPIYLGNRNWHPFIVDVLREIYQAKHYRLLAITTAAYACYSGCRQYREDLGQALEILSKEGLDISRFTIDKTRPYYLDEGFLSANTDALVAALNKLPYDDETCQIVFVTHSIPTNMQNFSGPGDASKRYLEQHLEVARYTASEALRKTKRNIEWVLTFCSRSGAPHHPWLEPDINDHLTNLAQTKIKAVIAAPIGFVSDHMEVVNDLDYEAANTAAEAGLKFVRSATPGTHPKFIETLVKVLCERADIARAKRKDNSIWATPCPQTCCLPSADYTPLPYTLP